MRRLLPDNCTDVDLLEALRMDSVGRTQVRLGMVMSVDGSVTDEDGWTAKLGGPADRRMLRTMRGVSDAILVGAGSIRTGRYPPHWPMANIRDWRNRAGKARYATLIVVTRSGDIDWSLPAFADAHTPTLVLTCASSFVSGAFPKLVRERVLVYGDAEVDFRAGLGGLRERFGFADILCEGGPGLGTQLFESEMVDELMLSVAPSILPGQGRRLANLARRQELDLREIYEEGGEVFLRYRVGSIDDRAG